jgi:hypothetical protein
VKYVSSLKGYFTFFFFNKLYNLLNAFLMILIIVLGINLFSGIKADKVCQVCLKSGDIIRCRGSCMGYYHIECAYKERKKESVEMSGQKKALGRKRKSKPPAPPPSQEAKGVVETKPAKAIGVGARRSLRLTSREEEEEERRRASLKDNGVKKEGSEGDFVELEENSNEKVRQTT